MIINVFMCLRNNEQSIDNTFRLLNDMETKNKSYSFRYYMYENDSVDKTQDKIIDFFKTHNGEYLSQSLNTKFWDSISDKNRAADMSIYRNEMKNLCTDFSNSKYSIILDTNIDFSNQTFIDMKVLLENNNKIAMVTPFGFEKGNPLKYYDSFALDIESQYYGNKLKKLRMELNNSEDSIVKIKSGFAGFVVIRTEILEKCNWSSGNKLCSEHNYFCDEVNKHGDIVLAGNIKISWTK